MLSAFSFMRNHHLTRYYIVILLLVFALLAGGFWAANPLSLWVSQWINSLFSAAPDSSNWQSILINVVAGIGRVLSWIITVMLVCILSSYLALIILSPLFSFWAEKCIIIITQKEELPFSLSRLLRNTLRSIRIVVRNFVIQMLIVLALLLVSLIPGMGIFAAIGIALVDAFFLGFSMADYSMEALQLNVGESVRFAHSHKSLIVGIGLPYSLVAKIPIVGLYIAILIAPLCVVGAARSLANSLAEDKNVVIAQSENLG